jgi:hypothetical protein
MQKILVVATNDASIINGKRTGLWLSELTHFLEVVDRAGLGHDLCSPRGGKIPLDESSVTPKQLADPANARFMQRREFTAALENSRACADVVASDHHPLAESFLAYNAGLNDLPAVTYRDLPWAVPDATLGTFDLIIGSDILYERDHALQVAAMMLRHSFSMEAEANAIENAVATVLDEGVRPRDIGGTSRTGEVGDAVLRRLP